MTDGDSHLRTRVHRHFNVHGLLFNVWVCMEKRIVEADKRHDEREKDLFSLVWNTNWWPHDGWKITRERGRDALVVVVCVVQDSNVLMWVRGGYLVACRCVRDGCGVSGSPLFHGLLQVTCVLRRCVVVCALSARHYSFFLSLWSPPPKPFRYCVKSLNSGHD